MDNMANGDSFNMVMTPEASPERDANAEREVGGGFNQMAQRNEAASRSVRIVQMERHHSDLHGDPPAIEVELVSQFGDMHKGGMGEESKRSNRFRQSTLTERHMIGAHPLATSPSIKNSLIDWVTTFKNLPHIPGTTSEFITSGALYYIMEEIDPEYFPELPYSQLDKKDLRANHDIKVLRKVYKHMLEQMDLWF